jgi:hypothetical protein
MRASCTSCEKPFMFDDGRFGDRQVVKVRCPSCKEVVSLRKPAPAAAVSVPVPAENEPVVPETLEPHAAPAATEPAPSGEPAVGPPTLKVQRKESETDESGEVIPPLPADRRVALAVLSGAASGQVLQCNRSRVVLGRKGSDIPIDDEEVSRRHAILEIHEDRYILKDLGSTNGTFVDERRISEMEIPDKGEFRVGNTQIMLIVTPNEDL